ncbi:MAG: baseplate J/gp47 family protein [Cyanobacteria bacterium SBLK]|nr:baseplate J/gp47 family protein [Cyanobacteria bacterium SBLK]
METDDNLRKRIILAPESFSNAGSAGAYRFHALSASQDIIDVGVRGASLLASTVDPPASFKADLQAIANGDLDGIDPVEVNFKLEVAIASPAQNLILEAWEWANCSGISGIEVEIKSLS